MTDPANDNDIDALLRYLHSGHTPHWYDDSTRWHAALTALVAERDALNRRVAELEAPILNPLSSALELKLEQTLDEMRKGATDGK